MNGISVFLANAVLKRDLIQSFGTLGHVAKRLPINSHAFFVCSGPLVLKFFEKIPHSCRAILVVVLLGSVKVFQTLLILRITESPNASHDQTCFLALLIPRRRVDTFLKNFESFILTFDRIECTTLIKQITRSPIAGSNVLFE